MVFCWASGRGSFEAGRRLLVRPVVPVFRPQFCLRNVGRRQHTRVSLPGGIPAVHHARIHFANQPLHPRLVTTIFFFFSFFVSTKTSSKISEFIDVRLEPHGPWLKSDVPTVIGLGVGMSVFMALTCLVLRLFSRARFAQEQARGYGNAHLAPPTSASTTMNHTHTGPTPYFRLLLTKAYATHHYFYYLFFFFLRKTHCPSPRLCVYRVIAERRLLIYDLNFILQMESILHGPTITDRYPSPIPRQLHPQVRDLIYLMGRGVVKTKEQTQKQKTEKGRHIAFNIGSNDNARLATAASTA